MEQIEGVTGVEQEVEAGTDEAGPPASEHVRAVRQAMDITQRRLSELLGVTLRTICRWEAGDSRPNRIYIERMDAMLLEHQVVNHG